MNDTKESASRATPVTAYTIKKAANGGRLSPTGGIGKLIGFNRSRTFLSCAPCESSSNRSGKCCRLCVSAVGDGDRLRLSLRSAFGFREDMKKMVAAAEIKIRSH